MNDKTSGPQGEHPLDEESEILGGQIAKRSEPIAKLSHSVDHCIVTLLMMFIVTLLIMFIIS
jgi:hypothetical protein